ncbi:MAG: restriction endonuclease subunit S [Pseudomonadota bacterium]
MNTEKLGGLVSVVTGKLDVNAGDENGSYPFFTCAIKPYKINKYAFDSEAILIAGNGDLNVKYYKGKFNAYQRTYVLKKKQSINLNMKYLYYFMKIYIEHLRKGAIGGIIKYIKLAHLTEAKIPLPSPDDQTRIATLLFKVESLMAKRKKSITDLDELLKSTFLEMFGDPVRNERGWDKVELGNLLKNIDSGWSPKCEPHEARNGEWGVLKLGAVTYCSYDEKENKALIQGTSPKKNIEVRAGDNLFSRKNTYELVAACAYVFKTKPQLMLSDLIFRLVLEKEAEIHPIFLWKLLTNYSQRKKIQSLAGGAAGSMPNISKTKLKTAKIVLPPLNIQNQFAAIVEKVESTKEKYQNSLNDLETLYGALSQKAFKGELDLSRVPLVHELKPKDITTGAPQPGKPSLTVQEDPKEELVSQEQTGKISDVPQNKKSLKLC